MFSELWLWVVNSYVYIIYLLMKGLHWTFLVTISFCVSFKKDISFCVSWTECNIMRSCRQHFQKIIPFFILLRRSRTAYRHPCCKSLLALVEPLIKTDEHRHVLTELLSCWMSSVFIHIHVQISRVHVCVTLNQRYLQNATFVFLITVLGTSTTAKRQSSWDGEKKDLDNARHPIRYYRV